MVPNRYKYIDLTFPIGSVAHARHIGSDHLGMANIYYLFNLVHT